MTPFEPIAAADAMFTLEADFVIVGLGAAGACAAIEARALGLDVLVIERASGGGGSTAASGGYIYIGGGTDAQKAHGFEDTAENMIAFLTCEMPEPAHDKIRAYCEESVAHYEWLKAQGVPFNTKFYAGKHFEVPSDETLSYTGGEKAHPYNKAARPVPRGHMVAAQGAAGHVLVNKLIASAEQAGARFEYDANVDALVTDEKGRVVGLRFRRLRQEHFVRARHGVLLATGGFAMNQKMAAKFIPVMAREDVHIVGGPYSDGAGIRLGTGVGAATAHMDAQLITSPLYPPEGYLKGVLVNKLGERFVAEDSYHARTSEAIVRQPGHCAYLIVDSAMYEPPTFGQQQLIDVWNDFATMERDLGLPEGSLQETIATYNRDAAEGHDSVQHKHADWCQPLTEAPFAAIDCSLGKALFSGFSLGGLRVDIDAHVLDTEGRAIEGLYAAGAAASNLAQGSMTYASGVCLGETTYFGRRAARAVARSATTRESA
jgi:succinate dehydrogenase/fumarate reductase flavoprotein subunit